MTDVSRDECSVIRRSSFRKAEIRIQFEHRLMRFGDARPRDNEEVRRLAQLAGYRLHVRRGVAKEERAALCSQAIADRIGQRVIIEQALS